MGWVCFRPYITFQNKPYVELDGVGVGVKGKGVKERGLRVYE